MSDWKAIAKAKGLPLSEAQAAKADTVLRQLEADFGSLKQMLTSADQPATVFVPAESDSQ